MANRRLPRFWAPALGLTLSYSIASAAPIDFVPWRADFHMHIRSQAAYDTEVVMCASFGPGACHLDTEHQARGGADAIAAFKEVGAAIGVVLSMAYMFGAPLGRRSALRCRAYDAH